MILCKGKKYERVSARTFFEDEQQHAHTRESQRIIEGLDEEGEEGMNRKGGSSASTRSLIIEGGPHLQTYRKAETALMMLCAASQKVRERHGQGAAVSSSFSFLPPPFLSGHDVLNEG